MILRGVAFVLGLLAAPPEPPVAEPYFFNGNFVGMRFDGFGRPVARVDNISLVCPASIARAQKRLRVSGLDVKSPDDRSEMVDSKVADAMADQLDRLMATRSTEVEALGVQLTYNQKRKVPRIAAVCEGSMFEKLGLMRDDLILLVGDRRVRGRESAAVALKYLDDTAPPALRVRRKDDEVVLSGAGHAPAVRALLAVMARSLAMVPDPSDDQSGVEPAPVPATTAPDAGPTR